MESQRAYRRFHRRNFEAAVSLWNNRIPEVVSARDISRSGMFIETAADISPGSFLTLTLQLAERPRFSALCRVVRAESGDAGGIGVVFVDVRHDDREAITAYVDEPMRAMRRHRPPARSGAAA